MYERGDLRHEPASAAGAVLRPGAGTRKAYLRDVERLDIGANKFLDGPRRRVTARPTPPSRPGTPSSVPATPPKGTRGDA